MSLKSVVAVFPLAFLLFGCASLENRTSAERFIYSGGDGESAVVIVSAGAPKMCVSMAHFLKVLDVDSPYNGHMLAQLPIDNYSIKGDYADHFGFLHVFRLKAGSYYLTTGVYNPYVKVLNAPRADFEVSAGEVVYLGEFFMKDNCGLSNAGVFSDQSERDFVLLKSKNPTLSQASIQKRIPKINGSAGL